ncbi:MAG: DUF4924 family protein [Mariniphaga sp.]|nr:DUF4924 family protein [Mariniphaga sp.]
MFVAKKKRKENIAEYILYMFQVEDLIRAFKLDMKLIKEQLISRYDLDDSQMNEVVDWYSNLVAMMVKEELTKKGHLQFLMNHINELNEFHLRILKDDISTEYSSAFKNNIGLINEFRLKGNAAANDIESCLNGIYGYLLLKIQNKEISTGTEDAVKQFGKLMGLLSALFKQFEAGDLEL